MVAQGLILVSSTTERDVAGQDRDGNVGSRAARTKASSSSHKSASSTAQADGQVSQALRSVYQRAVEEDIPSEMLDLLSKLD